MMWQGCSSGHRSTVARMLFCLCPMRSNICLAVSSSSDSVFKYCVCHILLPQHFFRPLEKCSVQPRGARKLSSPRISCPLARGFFLCVLFYNTGFFSFQSFTVLSTLRLSKMILSHTTEASLWVKVLITFYYIQYCTSCGCLCLELGLLTVHPANPSLTALPHVAMFQVVWCLYHDKWKRYRLIKQK